MGSLIIEKVKYSGDKYFYESLYNINHRWQEVDKGLNLRKKISSRLFSIIDI